jgi:hypothetical protein
MRFKTSNLKEAKHTDLVSCVGWGSPDDVMSAGDDHKIYRFLRFKICSFLKIKACVKFLKDLKGF